MRRLVYALVAVVGLTTSCSDPSFVEKVEIANPYEYDVIAAVSGDGKAWLSLGVLNRGDEVTRLQVIDLGERWFFRFRYPYDDDVEPAVLSLTRSDLAGVAWRVEVPRSLAETLRKRGEPASYDG